MNLVIHRYCDIFHPHSFAERVVSGKVRPKPASWRRRSSGWSRPAYTAEVGLPIINRMLVDPDLVWFIGAVVSVAALMMVVSMIAKRLKERPAPSDKQQ